MWGWYIANHFDGGPPSFSCLHVIADWEDEESAELALTAVEVWLAQGGKGGAFQVELGQALELIKEKYQCKAS